MNVARQPLRTAKLPWSYARVIALSRLPQASAAIPAIGYGLLWSDQFSSWLADHERLGRYLFLPVEWKLQLLWWGALAMTAGYLLFLARCPNTIRRGDIHDYIFEQFQLQNGNAMDEIARRLERDFLQENADEPDGPRYHPNDTTKNLLWDEMSPNDLYKATQIHPADRPFEPKFAAKNTLLLRANYHLLDGVRPYSRILSIVLLAGGAAAFLTPSFEVACRVVRRIIFGV